jgi:hypothetical protein
MNRLVYYLIGIILITLSLSGIGYFMLCGAVPVNMLVIKQNVSRFTGNGVVLNNTSVPITISSDTYMGIVPPGKTSTEAGTKDADAIIIDRPMVFEGKTVDNKVFKFCNLATIELTEGPKKEIVINNRKYSWVCKLVGDYTLYDTVKKAFNQE